MARTGLYKSEVKKARDYLLSQGKRPSVDALRIELGNTGSKTTIHKYLKELEEEDGGQSPKASLSDTLQDLVARLAAQLQAEADVQVAATLTQAHEAAEVAATEILQLRRDKAELETKLRDASAASKVEKDAHEQTYSLLQDLKTTKHGLELQLSTLHDRLSENEQHRQSLEEKHQHAREALEHYRTSVKEQRDQDLRRHEQQLQVLQAEIRQLRQDAIVKQDEVTRLNQEGARLVADLSHAKQAQYESSSRLRQLEPKLELASAYEQRCRALEESLEQKIAESSGLHIQIADLLQQLDAIGKQHNQSQIELAALQAQLETHKSLSAELQSLFTEHGRLPNL